MIWSLSILLVLGLTVGAMIPFAIFLHEMGHAIPILLFSKVKCVIYIGSYVSKGPDFCIRLGRLEFRILKRAWHLYQANTVAEVETLPHWLRIAHVLGGPVVSLLVSMVCVAVAFLVEWPAYVLPLSMLFGIISFVVFLWNIQDEEYVITHTDGEGYSTDGRQFKMALEAWRIERAWKELKRLYASQDWKHAYSHCLALTKRYPEERVWFLNGLHLAYLVQEYAVGYSLGARLLQMGEPEVEVYTLFGLCCSYLDQHLEALECYRAALRLAPDAGIGYHNVAFTLNLLEKPGEALEVIQAGIDRFPDAYLLHGTRGQARLKLGDEQGGLADLDHCILNCPECNYAYLHLGEYHLNKGERKTALSYFEKAKAVDPNTHGLAVMVSRAGG